jgi:hypothetical protein
MSNSPSPVAVTPLSRSLLGVWQLKTRTDIDPKGQPKLDPVLGRDPLGMLCFAGAIVPGNIGKYFDRKVRVVEDELTVQLNTTAADGTPVSRALVFSRLG